MLVLIPGEQTPVRIERLAAGEDAERWRGAIGAVLAGGGELLKVDGRSRVAAAGEAVFKVRELSGAADRWRARLGLAREERQWRGAVLLGAAGIPTAKPLAIARAGDLRVFVLARLPGETLLEHLARRDLAPGQELALARAAGSWAGRAVRAGLINRDAKPSNWIVTSMDAGRPGLAMIDTVGVRRTRARNRAEAMLASMVIEAIGVGACPRRAVLWAAIRAFAGEVGGSRAEAKGWWRGAVLVIAGHGDPRPRVDPRSGNR